jgi:outer membrane protein
MTRAHTQSGAVAHERFFCSVAFIGTTSVIAAQTSVTQTSPVSSGAVTMTEVVQSALGDYPLIHITQEEFNAC